MKQEYITIYQLKSGFCNVEDGIMLTKPSSDFYDILHVILPKGYEYVHSDWGPAICNPAGKPCELSRAGAYSKSGPVIAYTFRELGTKEENTMVELPFYEE